MSIQLVEAAVAHVIATEKDRATQGVPIVVQNRRFDRVRFIRQVVTYFMSSGYNPDTEDHPTAFVGMRKEHDATQLLRSVNGGLAQAKQGKVLRDGTKVRDLKPLMFGGYGALRAMMQQASTDSFDLLIINAQTPNELDRFYGMFATLEPMFTVFILPATMHAQGELEHWQHLEPSYMVT